MWFIIGIVIAIVTFLIQRSITYDVDTEHFRIVQEKRGIKTATRFIGFGVAAVIIILSLIRVVPAGHVGVQVLWGKVLMDATLSEGLQLVNPFVTLEMLSVRTQVYTMSIAPEEGAVRGRSDAISALTKDGLEIDMDLSIWFHLRKAKAAWVYQKIGKDYVEKIVRPASRTAIRNATVRYNAVEIYSEKRREVADEIDRQLRKDLEERGIALERVLLRNVKLPPKVKAAIEAKLEAEQEAQKMEFVLQKERKEAERKKVEAEGIAKAQNIIAQSLTGVRGARYLQWQYLRTLNNFAQSQNNTIIITPFDKSLTPNLFYNVAPK
ncbi:prohibitin family protein [candidate division WOR-3 bacterium]|uniref:Prohibitin family protein n=1 Tax=candidate division WOR-3 bacterium TaxID=2052148 RepID=A0A660SDI2_UNCW3|nr:MAG: prohibitin family protein [candidate division WOR-3 bacterium]